MDETRVGQQGRLTQVWAPRGSRPRMVLQTEYKWGYVFGAVNPLTGQTSAIIAPRVDTGTMNSFLAVMSSELATDAQAVLVLDGAGYHTATALKVPANISLLFLPPYAPELMPMERVWLWMKQQHLSNRVFKDEAEIDDACGKSWRSLDVERVKSVAGEPWVTELGELPALAATKTPRN